LKSKVKRGEKSLLKGVFQSRLTTYHTYFTNGGEIYVRWDPRPTGFRGGYALAPKK